MVKACGLRANTKNAPGASHVSLVKVNVMQQ